MWGWTALGAFPAFFSVPFPVFVAFWGRLSITTMLMMLLGISARHFEWYDGRNCVALDAEKCVFWAFRSSSTVSKQPRGFVLRTRRVWWWLLIDNGPKLSDKDWILQRRCVHVCLRTKHWSRDARRHLTELRSTTIISEVKLGIKPRTQRLETQFIENDLGPGLLVLPTCVLILTVFAVFLNLFVLKIKVLCWPVNVPLIVASSFSISTQYTWKVINHSLVPFMTGSFC
jgi:hypothetical protein